MIESAAIRSAENKDIPAILAIQSDALNALQVPIGRYSRKEWQRFFDDPRIFTYLCETDRPFGFVTAGVPLEDFFQDGEHGELIAVNILPTHRDHGYGKKLLVHGISVLKRRNFKRAILWIAAENERAIAIIDRLGFNPNGASRITNRDNASQTEYCYQLELEAYF
jgi:ribosomal protein S18 acetylase RimI-like enzyme